MSGELLEDKTAGVPSGFDWAPVLVGLPLVLSLQIPTFGWILVAPWTVLLATALDVFRQGRAYAFGAALAMTTFCWLPLLATQPWLMVTLCAPTNMSVHWAAATVGGVVGISLMAIASRRRWLELWIAAGIGMSVAYLLTWTMLGGWDTPFFC